MRLCGEFRKPPPLAGEVDERSSAGWGQGNLELFPFPNLTGKRGRERTSRVALATPLFAMLLIGASSAQQFVPRDENPEDFPAGAGRDDTFYACTACHGFKLVAQQGMTRRQWEDSIDLMVRRHNMPALPPKEQTIVLDYLEAAFPPRAPAAGRGWQNPFSPR